MALVRRAILATAWRQWRKGEGEVEDAGSVTGLDFTLLLSVAMGMMDTGCASERAVIL